MTGHLLRSLDEWRRTQKEHPEEHKREGVHIDREHGHIADILGKLRADLKRLEGKIDELNRVCTCVGGKDLKDLQTKKDDDASPWLTQDRKREPTEKAALWERYAPIRAEAKAAFQRANSLICDPNATREENFAAWGEAHAACMRSIEAHPDRVRRQKETSHHES